MLATHAWGSSGGGLGARGSVSSLALRRRSATLECESMGGCWGGYMTKCEKEEGTPGGQPEQKGAARRGERGEGGERKERRERGRERRGREGERGEREGREEGRGGREGRERRERGEGRERREERGKGEKEEAKNGISHLTSERGMTDDVLVGHGREQRLQEGAGVEQRRAAGSGEEVGPSVQEDGAGGLGRAEEALGGELAQRFRGLLPLGLRALL